MGTSPFALTSASISLAVRGDITAYERAFFGNACGDEAAWRMVELNGDGPTRVKVQWSKAGRSPVYALLTLARSARLFVSASTIEVWVSNLWDSTQTFGVSVVDAPGPLPSELQFEEYGVGVENIGVLHEIPPFARRVQVDFANRASAEAAAVSLVDGAGVIQAETVASQIDEAGWPLGGARYVKVIPSLEDELYRVVFLLGL